jgi:hypothetical protein
MSVPSPTVEVMDRRDDEELLENYQRSELSSRAQHIHARHARANGTVNYMAEAVAVLHDGEAAAYLWLLGHSPATPQRRLAAAVTPETISDELQVAKAEQAAGEVRFDERTSPDVDVAAHYANGVANALAWELHRLGLLPLS